MAKKLREIVVAVTADTGAYQREMSRVSRMGGDYFKSVEQGAKRADAAYQRNAASIRMQIAELGGATSALSEYARAAAGVFAGAKLVQYADQWGQISSRLKIAAGTQDEFISAQNRLMAVSGRVYKDYGQVSELFIRSNESLGQLGYTSEQALDLVEAFSYGLTVSATSSDKAATAVDALSKSIQTGKMSMDQFDSLIAAAPRLQQALADSLGVTNAQLRQMVAAGKLTTAELMRLSSQIKKMGEEADAMPVTVADAFLRLTNEIQRYIGEANQARGVTEYLTGGMNLLSENIGTVIEVGAAVALAGLTGKLLKTGRAARIAAGEWAASRAELVGQARASAMATAAQAEHARMQMVVAQANVAAASGMQRLALVQRELVPAQQAYARATDVAAVAQARLNSVSSIALGAGRGLLAALGGPAGLAVTVATVAAGWLLFRDNTDSASRALVNMAGPVDQVISKFKELNLVQQDVAVREIRKQLDAARSAMAAGYRSLERVPLKLRVSPDFGDFRQEVARLAAADLPFDELQSKLVGLVESLAKTAPNAAAARASLMEFVGGTLQARREVDRLTGRLDAVTAAQTVVAKGAQAMGAAVTSAIGGMVSADWDKYLKNLTTARDVIGLTGQQAAEYKAKAEGANQAQAVLAGAIAGQIEAAQKLQKATQDKDAKAIAGAKATLLELVQVEAQQRAIIASAQEAVRLQVALSKGLISPSEFNSMVAAAGRAARDVAVAEGTQRTGGQIASIGRNALPSKSVLSEGNDWSKWVKERKAEVAAQNDLAAAYLKGGAAVEKATQAKRIEEEVIKQNGKHRAEIVALLNAEAQARSQAGAAKQISEMGKEIALIDAKTEAERILWETQHGSYAALDDNIKKALVGRARELDLARKAQAQRAYIGQASGHTEADDTLEKMGWLADALDRNQLSAEQYKRALHELTGEGLDSLTEFAVQGARNIQSYLGDSLYQVVSGKFEGLGVAFADMLARMAAEAAAANLGEMLFGSFGKSNQIGGVIGALGGAVGGLFGGASSTLPDTASWAMPKFAKGGVFTNDVVNSPTMFSMGLMGEAGPEAIMPLHRGADGSLGVRARFPSPAVPAGGLSGGMAVTINVDRRGETRSGSTGGAEEFERGLAAAVQAYVRQFVPIEINKSFRANGALWNAQNGRKA